VENLPPIGRGAVAEAIRPLPVRPEPDVISRAQAGQEDRPRQGSLFSNGPQEQSGRERLQIVRPAPGHELRKELLSRASGRANGRAARSETFQQSIAFPQQAARPDAGATDASIYCNAPVALPTHRVLAAAIDGVMVTLALGLFVSVLYGMGVEIVIHKGTVVMYGLAVLVTMAVYRAMWCLAGIDSVGLRWSGLQLLTFDGGLPSREDRMTRLLSTHVSWAAGGLGLAWALVDEEKLAWHDHMSKTFPTLRVLPGNRSQGA
jgi:hypothetical protein